MPAIDRDTHHDRADQTAEIPEGVHEAGDDPCVVSADVEADRPAGSQGKVG